MTDIKRNINPDVFMSKPDVVIEDITVEKNKTTANADNQPVINVESLTKTTENTVNNTLTTNTVKVKDRGNGNIDVIRFKHLTQIFNKGQENEYQLFKDFSLEIKDFAGTFQSICVMGASGCGKSRLMRVLCHLDDVDEGSVEVYGKTDYPSIPCVFQSYSNFEWMTVLENIMLPMKVRGINKEDAEKKAYELLDLIDMKDKANLYPSRLSGGQQQRISIARALACDSQIIVLDEATSALDVQMKRQIQNTILKILYDYDKDPTIIAITHNIEEALYTANQIIILKPNPCTVHMKLDIHYPGEETRQRGEWIFETPKYVEYTKILTKAMEEIC